MGRRSRAESGESLEGSHRQAVGPLNRPGMTARRDAAPPCPWGAGMRSSEGRRDAFGCVARHRLPPRIPARTGSGKIGAARILRLWQAGLRPWTPLVGDVGPV